VLSHSETLYNWMTGGDRVWRKMISPTRHLSSSHYFPEDRIRR
jgi:hypothetical protein